MSRRIYDINMPEKERDSNKKNKSNISIARIIIEISLVVALVVVIGYLIFLHVHLSSYQSNEDSDDIEACISSECYKSAEEIKEFIDPVTNPCDDFHQFVCGNYLRRAYTEGNINPLYTELLKFENEFKGLIVEPIYDNDSHAIKMQKKFFQSCMNVNETESDADIILQLFREITKYEHHKWTDIMIKCKELGLPFQWFLSFDLYVQEENETNLLKISYPYTELYLGDDYNKRMVNLMYYMADLNIINLSGGLGDIENVFVLNKKLYDLIGNKTDEPIIKTIEELDKIKPKFKWVHILNKLAGENKFTAETEIASNIDEYIVALDNLLVGTNKKTEINYIFWKIFQYFEKFLHYRKTDTDYIVRFEFCLQKTSESFPHLSDTTYIRKYLNPNKEESVTNISNFIRNEILERIQIAEIMDNETKEFHLEQFSTTIDDLDVYYAAVDEEFLDQNLLHIGDLNFTSDNVIEMFTERSKSYYDSLFGAIGEVRISTKQKGYIERAIYFDNDTNRMVVPSFVLHGFLYDDNRPKYLNFGGLGSLIAKELIKSLDIEHIISVEDEISQNSTIVLEELVAEIIGRDVAYSAYQKWVEENYEEPLLHDLDYTPNQLFWIKSSSINCYQRKIDTMDETDEDKIYKLKNELAAKHSNYFAEDFDCSKESPMNLKHKYMIIL